jgi:hypothetical protein
MKNAVNKAIFHHRKPESRTITAKPTSQQRQATTATTSFAKQHTNTQKLAEKQHPGEIKNNKRIAA